MVHQLSNVLPNSYKKEYFFKCSLSFEPWLWIGKLEDSDDGRARRRVGQSTPVRIKKIILEPFRVFIVLNHFESFYNTL